METKGMSAAGVERFLEELKRPFRTEMPEPQPEFAAVASFWAKCGVEQDGQPDETVMLMLALAHERRLVNDLLAVLKPLCAEYRAEIDARYAPLEGYPDNARRKARDLATVSEAEAVIARAEHEKAQTLPESQ